MRDGPIVARTPSGISGLDDITHGGLPRGRTTLVSGGPGCGKTILALQFLVRGADEYGEPGLFVSFEESEEDIRQNALSVGFDLDRLTEENKVRILPVELNSGELEVVGPYTLDGLFARLGLAIDGVGAKRVSIDTVDVLFSAFENDSVLRAELRRLFLWLREKGVTAVVTAERGRDRSITRHGLEEYVSDCVITLDHRVTDQVATRRARVVKYRGSQHGTGEYPFLIDQHGITIVPITSLGLDHPASNDRLSSGLADLDEMLGSGGYFRGSTILVSGAAGTGKSSIASSFVAAAAERGEKALYFTFEESASQVIRNMRSIGLDLKKAVDKGFLGIIAARPSMFGLEHHLAEIHRAIESEEPDVIVLDPITNFEIIGNQREANAMLTRVVDLLKSRGITALMTTLSAHEKETVVGISSIVDTWLQVRNMEQGGERNRALYILKSRGMAHSNQVREFLITSEGIRLIDVFVGPGGVLIGSARRDQEVLDMDEAAQGDGADLERRRESARGRQHTGPDDD